MEENRFNQTLRDKFQDLESPCNDRLTFEAVMKKREKKKRRAFFQMIQSYTEPIFIIEYRRL